MRFFTKEADLTDGEIKRELDNPETTPERRKVLQAEAEDRRTGRPKHPMHNPPRES